MMLAVPRKASIIIMPSVTSIYGAPFHKAPLDEPWRLLSGYAVPSVLNMAIDEVLLESVIAGGAPVVRFYTWQPATISLGVNQAVGEIDLAECACRGFGVVRRLTGGRAVLHQHELTYAVIAREHDLRVSGGVVESYRKISAALVEGLGSLGTAVELAPPNPAQLRATASRHGGVEDAGSQNVDSSRAVCFDAASAYELTAGGKKLVGSAQARRGGALLQHGSILLDIDWDAWVSVFKYATEAGKQRAYSKLPSRMTSLKHELGREVSAAEVANALQAALEHVFSVDLESGNLTQDEEGAAMRFAADKYGSDEWTLRR